MRRDIELIDKLFDLSATLLKEGKNDAVWGVYGRICRLTFELRENKAIYDSLQLRLYEEQSRFLLYEKNYNNAVPNLIVYSVLSGKQLDIASVAKKADYHNLTECRINEFMSRYKAGKNTEHLTIEAYDFLNRHENTRNSDILRQHDKFSSWAYASFTEDDLSKIKKTSPDFGRLLHQSLCINANTVLRVSGMALGFLKKSDLEIGVKFANFAYELHLLCSDLDHFKVTLNTAEVFYKDRANKISEERFEEMCRFCFRRSKEMFAKIVDEKYKKIWWDGVDTDWLTSLSQQQENYCFTQMAIHLERKKRYLEAIDICEQAMSEGWLGDWQKRIDRMQSKQEKSKK